MVQVRRVLCLHRLMHTWRAGCSRVVVAKSVCEGQGDQSEAPYLAVQLVQRRRTSASERSVRVEREERGGHGSIAKYEYPHWENGRKWRALAAMLAVAALLLPSAAEWRGSPHTVVIRRSKRVLFAIERMHSDHWSRARPRHPSLLE